ncbi:anti-sigma factor RsbA family regulatory protein [Streptomyces sp. NPDC020480]|uniref:anti-sigma factor RsbA family regulatory protein n=1 Tax=Streptomyces sp. NPDC020480 TaxID=3365076 RepID=UPI0037BB7607
MTGQSSGVAEDRGSMVHRGFLYQDEEEVVSVGVPFLRAGLEADDAVAVVASKANITALRDALGQDASSVQFEDALSWYQHPVRTIAAYDAYVKAQKPRRARLVAEPVWQGRTPLEVVEWARYESIVNAAFSDSGARVICCYDRETLPNEILDYARRTHPEMIDGEGPRRSPQYTDPGPFIATCDRRPLPRAPRLAEMMSIDTADMDALRAFATERADRHGLAGDALRDMVAAVVEVATTAARRGRAPAALRMWTDNGDLVSEISGPGHWYPDALWGFAPPADSEPAFGLWGVRMLCDVVQMQADTDGTVIRLRTRI